MQSSTSTSYNHSQRKPGNAHIIFGTVRPDGSKRKDIKVRPGFTPPEEMKKYVPPSKRVIPFQ